MILPRDMSHDKIIIFKIIYLKINDLASHARRGLKIPVRPYHDLDRATCTKIITHKIVDLGVVRARAREQDQLGVR